MHPELQFNPQPGLNDDGEDVRKLVNFMRFLGAPPRGLITADVIAGEAVFTRIGWRFLSCPVAAAATTLPSAKITQSWESTRVEPPVPLVER